MFNFALGFENQALLNTSAKVRQTGEEYEE